MAVILTTAYDKIKALNKRFRVVRGGMSSSKTYSILTLLCELALETKDTTITVVTSTYPLLRDGVITDMKNIFNATDLPFNDWYHKSDKDLIFPNESVIQFRNLDALDTHKGKGSRRDYLFCNESNRLSYSTLDPMIVRTDKAIFFDYNPDMPHFVEEIFLKGGRTDVDFLTLTYKANQLIPDGELQTILDRIELSKQPNAPENIKNWTRIFAYGEMGTYSDRMIYSYQFCDKIPGTAKQLNSGMDFAQSPDQTVLVDMYLDGVNLYVDERFALNNLAAEKIDGSERMSVVDQMDLIEFPKGRMIIGDTSGKLSILDMRNHGYNILAVKKNLPIYEGINKVKAYNLFITKRSVSLKKGIENWFWKVDANSKIIPEPQGHEPDGLAALRYAMLYYSQ